MSFWGVISLKRKPGPPINILCLQELNVSHRGADQMAVTCPESHPDKQSQRVPWGRGCTQLQDGSYVPRNLDVWLIICSSSDQRCDKLGIHGHSCAHRQLKRIFVSWSFTSSGQKPRSNGKGGKQIPLPAPH